MKSNYNLLLFLVIATVLSITNVSANIAILPADSVFCFSEPSGTCGSAPFPVSNMADGVRSTGYTPDVFDEPLHVYANYTLPANVTSGTINLSFYILDSPSGEVGFGNGYNISCVNISNNKQFLLINATPDTGLTIDDTTNGTLNVTLPSACLNPSNKVNLIYTVVYEDAALTFFDVVYQNFSIAGNESEENETESETTFSSTCPEGDVGADCRNIENLGKTAGATLSPSVTIVKSIIFSLVYIYIAGIFIIGLLGVLVAATKLVNHKKILHSK